MRKLGINSLSLFNGVGGAYLAMKELGIIINKLYVSEIDKFSNKGADSLYKNNIHLGDILEWRTWEANYSINFAEIDIIYAGFPCQAWSPSGKQNGTSDPRGKLVNVLLDIYNHIKILNPDVKFMFENVSMKKEFMTFINKLFQVTPTLLNSSLVTAQTRKRNYWTNWKINPLPDLGIYLEDILEEGSEFIKFTRPCILRKDVTFNKVKNPNKRHPKVFIGAIRGRYTKDGKVVQQLEVNRSGKSNCLTTVQKDNVVVLDKDHYRKLTPKEYYRLQGFPEESINTLLDSGLSNSQLYKICGNGWSHPVIVHNLKCLLSTGWLKSLGL
jgi:site-specific DNA-cytosine methylase